MQNHLQQPKGLPIKTPIPEPVYERRRPLSLSCGFPDSGKFGLDQRREQDTKASVLHKPSFPRCRRKISSCGKNLFHIDYGFKKTSFIFPGTSNCCNDGSTIKNAMSKPNTASRMVQWAIKLSQFDIEYRPWLVIKAQLLVDFIAEFSFSDDNQVQLWIVHTDSSSIKKLGGARVIMISSNNNVLKYGVYILMNPVISVGWKSRVLMTLWLIPEKTNRKSEETGGSRPRTLRW